MILSQERQCTQEAAAAGRQLELEKKATSLAGQERDIALKERDLARDQAVEWEQMYKIATKKPSKTCRVLSAIFTLGIYQCRP
jgi:hypothetical protein